MRRSHYQLVIAGAGLDCTYDTLLWCADLKSLYALADLSGLDDATILKIGSRKRRVMECRGGDSVFSL